MPKLSLGSPVLLLHVGWAQTYDGQAEDVPQGSFGYFKKGNTDGGERLNFKPQRGNCLGYAPLTTLKLRRLGGTGKEKSLDNVLVVGTATDPARSQRFVVGWYRNARVFAELANKRPDDLGRPGIIARAKTADCHLVPVTRRSFWIPTGSKHGAGWPGTSSAFYASDTWPVERLTRLLSYVDGQKLDGMADFLGGNVGAKHPVSSNGGAEGEQGKKAKGGRRGAVDLEHRIAVEAAAIRIARAHYLDLGWEVQSVETDNVGWDLRAIRADEELLIEVKGRDREGPVELTPNEFAAMRHERYQENFRLAVVWYALGEAPTLTIFGHHSQTDTWRAPGGAILDIKPRTAALASFTLPAKRQRGKKPATIPPRRTVRVYKHG